jgi:hypothetical protein
MAEIEISLTDENDEPQIGSPRAATDAGDTNKLTRREQVQRMREQKANEEKANLTFKPTVPQRRGRDSDVATSNVNRFDRLYGEAKARKERVKPTDNAPTFKPTITALGQAKKRSSTPEGLSKILYSTSGSGRKKEASPAPSPSFKPEISKRGKSLDRNREVSPSTRLYAQAEITKQKLAKKAEEKAKDETKDCTFTPQTNAKTATPSKEDVADVTARMQRYMLLKEKKLEELRLAKAAEENQVATFKPATYTSNRRSLSRERSGEQGDVFNRLHNHTRRLSDSNDAECTFRPTLVAAQPVSVSVAFKRCFLLTCCLYFSQLKIWRSMPMLMSAYT